MPTVETNGIQTYYEEYGDGLPIIFAHGAGSDHGLWAEQMQPLTDEFRVIVYDLRGHGQTESPPADTWHIDEFTDDLADLIDELGLHQPVVCGHSIGGYIGYNFACEYPEKLSGLVTLGAGGPERLSLLEKVYVGTRDTMMARFADYDRVMSGMERIERLLLGEGVRVDMEDLMDIRKSHSCERRELTADQRENLDLALDSYKHISLDFTQISVPTLVLFGEHEPFHGNHQEYLRTRIPDVETRVIPDAPHNSYVNHADFVQESLREFLADRGQFDEAEVAV